MVVIGRVSIWQGFGINMLFFITELAGIPDELYECAQIDGASSARQFFGITLPVIAPVMKVIVMMAILKSLKMNELVFSSNHSNNSLRLVFLGRYHLGLFTTL